MHNPPGVIRGRWRGNEYRVIRELGRGTGGVVYQVSQASRHLALKIGNDSFALTSEVNVLKLFQKAQGSVLGPSLYDVDDWESPDGIRSFYVMNVVDGVPMHRYVREKGAEWMPVLVMQLLGFLAHLHDKGYVFGDLKPEHLLVTGHPPRLSWFDAGGMTRMGRAVKEYTELYDRGYWQMGDRKAEAQYDLFSTALIIAHVARGKPLQFQGDPLSTFIHQLEETELLHPYREVLKSAFLGRYRSAEAMKKDWFYAWQKSRVKRESDQNAFKHRRLQGAQGQTAVRQGKPKKKKRLWVKLIKFVFYLLLSSFLAFLVALYLIYQAL